MKNGWIKLHRSVVKHWIFQKPAYFKAWVDMLIEANYSHKTRLYNDKLVNIKRGEIATSIRSLAMRWGMTDNQVRHFLNLLENDHMINRNTDQNFTHLTICNYETYQTLPQIDHKSTTNKTQIDHKSTTTPKEVKKEKKYNKEYDVLVRWYLGEVVKLFPNKSSLKQSAIDYGIDAIDKLIRIDGYSFIDIKASLEWVVESYDVDAHFNWLPNLLSLASLRNKKESGGLTKFEKIFTQLPKYRKAQEKEYFFQCPECKDGTGVKSHRRDFTSICKKPIHKGKRVEMVIMEPDNA